MHETYLRKTFLGFRHFCTRQKVSRSAKRTCHKQYFSEPQIDHIDEGVLCGMIFLMLKSGIPAIRSAFKDLYGE